MKVILRVFQKMLTRKYGSRVTICLFAKSVSFSIRGLQKWDHTHVFFQRKVTNGSSYTDIAYKSKTKFSSIDTEYI
jgi:hypothetical protein